jgi:hypothetical protein
MPEPNTPVPHSARLGGAGDFEADRRAGDEIAV